MSEGGAEERPGAPGSTQERPGARRSAQERPGEPRGAQERKLWTLLAFGILMCSTIGRSEIDRPITITRVSVSTAIVDITGHWAINV